MSDQSKHAKSTDPRIHAALREYLERVDRGEAPDPDQFIAQHPQIAGELRSFIDAEVELRKLAAAEPAGGPAGRSTQSFTLGGLDTIAPQAEAEQFAQTGGGLIGEFGRYRIVRALGKGAMGTVYLAHDTQLERHVAIKTPQFEQQPTGERLERFYREARSAATLRHPNICPVYDVGQIDRTHYISMAYIDGHPLSAFIRSSKQQAERNVLIVVRKLALALQEAHDHGIVHRDLKPANIMVDKRSEPIIMDFGLARQTQRAENVRITQSGMLLGTPAYMSPEQIDAEPDKIGPPSDQYSLGVILYELLTGQLPFRGSLTAVMAQILTKETSPPSQLRPGLDLRIEAVCLKMMAKDPANRFPSVSAIADELAAILRNPDAKLTSPNPTGQKPAAPAATDPDVAASGIRQSVSKRSTGRAKQETSLAADQVSSLEELARKCLTRRDYDQAIQIIERIPEAKRNAGLREVLAKSRAKADDIAFLICEIDEAMRFNDRATALKKADELLKIKPGHHRALKVQEQFAGYGTGGAARLGPLAQFAQPWKEGGWIPWSVLAFGLAIFGVVSAVIILWLGRTAVMIDAQDAGIKIEVEGRDALITVPGKQSIKVEPGEQEIKVSYDGLETVTKRFTLKRGQSKILTVAIVDSKLMAHLENEAFEPRAGGAVAKREPPPLANSVQKPPGRPVLASTGKEAVNEAVAASIEAAVPLVAPFSQDSAQAAQRQWAASLKQSQQVTDSIGMKLTLIPPGEFLMGSTSDQVRAFLPGVPSQRRKTFGEDQYPQHRVRISRPFRLGTCEVTRGQFAAFVQATGYKTEGERDGQGGMGVDPKTGKVKRDKSFSWRNSGFPQNDSHPVVDVSWNDAVAFCKWLGQKEGTTYRLPTEAEWEYACRAGTTTVFSNGDDPRKLVEVANILDATYTATNPQRPQADFNDGYAGTAPVGSYHPNAFGLYDMHGNAWEWCQDRYDRGYYGHSPDTDPTGSPEGDRVMRGGAIDCPPRYCFSASRSSAKASERVGNLGFRVVLVVEPSTPSTAPSSTNAEVAISHEGFVPLFDGKSLAGWHTHPSQPGNWRVVDGVLIGSGSAVSHLYTERADFKNFDLRVEARINDRGNSGLIFRSSYGPRWPANKPKYPLGYEAQIDNSNVNDKTGSLFVGAGRAVVGISEALVPPGQWFTMEVMARANHIVITVDGQEIVKHDNSRFATGHIALQQMEPQTVVEFRKIEIRELPKEASDAASVADSPDPSFFNGKDLAGWQGLAGFWHVKNHAIVGSVPRGKRAHTFLASRRSYTDFDLKFRARVAGGIGNSGVQFRSQMIDRRKFTVIGPQCEICGHDPKSPYPSSSLLTEPHGKPDVPAAAGQVARIFKEDDFNDYEIRCVGKHVQITLNGETTVDADFPSMPDEGIIAWQMHGSRPPREVVFKDIELRDLSRH